MLLGCVAPAAVVVVVVVAFEALLDRVNFFDPIPVPVPASLRSSSCSFVVVPPPFPLLLSPARLRRIFFTFFCLVSFNSMNLRMASIWAIVLASIFICRSVSTLASRAASSRAWEWDIDEEVG